MKKSTKSVSGQPNLTHYVTNIEKVTHFDPLFNPPIFISNPSVIMGVVDAEFRNIGLERAESLTKDLVWFKEQGHSIPEPSSPGLEYSAYVENLSKKNPQAFLCHFYTTYFAHSAGGSMIGKQVAGKILNGKELDFYKWDGDLSQLLQNVRDKLDIIAEVNTMFGISNVEHKVKKHVHQLSFITYVILCYDVVTDQVVALFSRGFGCMSMLQSNPSILTKLSVWLALVR